MAGKVRLLGHPIHPMLIVFPLGLLATAFVFDVIFLVTGESRWTQTAFYMLGAGVLGGLLAAAFGWIDWIAIPSNTRAKAVGLYHGLGNVLVMIVFALSWYLRYGNPLDPGAVPIVLALIGVGGALVTGWLGGELVDRLGIGVDPGASQFAQLALGTPGP